MFPVQMSKTDLATRAPTHPSQPPSVVSRYLSSKGLPGLVAGGADVEFPYLAYFEYFEYLE